MARPTMERPALALVLAADRRGTIGRDGDLPWRLPNDLKHFKRLTIGHPMVMGRRTFESFGGPLPKRQHLVLSRDSSYRPEGAEVFPTLDRAIDAARGADVLFVVGGASLFADTLPLATDLHLTRVDAEVTGDVQQPDRFWRELGQAPSGGPLTETTSLKAERPLGPPLEGPHVWHLGRGPHVWHLVTRREVPADVRHDHPFAIEHYRRSVPPGLNDDSSTE